jgi:RimJ/RimL family protein N-acetyltransferase
LIYRKATEFENAPAKAAPTCYPGGTLSDRKYLFHPPGAELPDRFQTADFILQPLLASHVELDFEAVMEDPAYLRSWSQSSWPADHFTLSENREDLERHELEHREGSAFTYTVLSRDTNTCLGCVYITPLGVRIAHTNIPKSHLPNADAHVADVCFWIRPSLQKLGLDSELVTALETWFATEWQFDRLYFHTSTTDHRQRELLHQAGLEQIAQFKAKHPRPGQWVLFTNAAK